jgi:hypothetical protein
MRKISHFIALIVFLFSTTLLSAQEKNSFNDTMRSNGRIYVVIAVILVILIGLILYLVRLDRKISKMEKNS